jgi:hypothetical protein
MITGIKAISQMKTLAKVQCTDFYISPALVLLYVFKWLVLA